MTSHSYYVVMQDFGKAGREAVVDPEHTRRDIIDKIRKGHYEKIIFIHRVDDGGVEDVTDELMFEAETQQEWFDRQARAINAQDYRKNGGM